MTETDYDWVYKELLKMEFISAIIEPWMLFHPTDDIYKKLASGNQSDLQKVVDSLSIYLNLSFFPIAKYDWSLKIPINSIGQIRNPGSDTSVIQIPFSSVGKPLAIGAIIAHEISHQFLYSNKIYYTDMLENEKLTDLASIAVGLGKFVLNGVAMEACGIKGLTMDFGYINTESKFFSYIVTCKQNRINEFDIYSSLVKDIEYRLKEFTSNNKRKINRITKNLRKMQ